MRIGNWRNLISPGRYLLQKSDFLAMYKSNWVSNHLFTSEHVHTDKEDTQQAGSCIITLKIHEACVQNYEDICLLTCCMNRRIYIHNV